MLSILSYLLGKGVATLKDLPETLDDCCTGLPQVTGELCADACDACQTLCPTNAIAVAGPSVTLDRGSCIGCNLCVEVCPTKTLVADRTTSVWSYDRTGLIQPKVSKLAPAAKTGLSLFAKSLAVRVVSTGCSACDLEVSASTNPIFDMDRFGISVVASPRFADALLVTGPVPKAMHAALKSAYQAMADPKIVIACGTCAISGGVHCNGYAEANGVSAVLPVDVFIPGCPPHPLQILEGLRAAQICRS
jgi:Ni,Fe-hydrogenase III small subunit/Pyruvate/2-oxoacid:ferredoxin oxidoreductase delta subunit